MASTVATHTSTSTVEVATTITQSASLASGIPAALIGSQYVNELGACAYNPPRCNLESLLMIVSFYLLVPDWYDPRTRKLALFRPCSSSPLFLPPKQSATDIPDPQGKSGARWEIMRPVVQTLAMLSVPLVWHASARRSSWVQVAPGHPSAPAHLHRAFASRVRCT
jgi:hypothetical protein